MRFKKAFLSRKYFKRSFFIINDSTAGGVDDEGKNYAGMW